MPWYQEGTVEWSVYTDALKVAHYFNKLKCHLTIVDNATQNEIAKDLGNANAAAFIGHNGSDSGDEMQFLTAEGGSIGFFDINMAINGGREIIGSKEGTTGRHLDIAIFHVCHAYSAQLKDATVGMSCHFYAPKGYWVAGFNVDFAHPFSATQ